MQPWVKVVIGGCVAITLLGAGLIWRESLHRFEASCDDRLQPSHPESRCIDYYRDEFEIACHPATMKQTPCVRAGALGGCREKTHITWYYGGEETQQTWRSRCSSSDMKVVGTDWKEPED